MSKKKPADQREFFFDLPKNRQHLIALGILFLVPFILFTATTLGGKQFLGDDVLQFRAGANSLIEYREATGEEPLWSTNLFSGMPATVISIKRAVPHLDTIIKQGMNWIYPAAQYWVLLFGSYLMFSVIGFRSLTAVAGSLLYGLTTYLPVIISAGHNTKLHALAYIPLVVASYIIITRTDKKILGFFLFAISLAFELRAQHPQITYYFIFFFVPLFAYDSYTAYKEGRGKEWLKVTGMLTIATLLAVGSFLDNYWQLYEYSAFSNRGGSAVAGNSTGLDTDYAFRWSQGVFESFTLLVPDLFGGAQLYWGEKPGTAGPHYLGVIAFVFLVIGLFKVRKPLFFIFVGVGFLAMMFAWGRHFLFLNELMFNTLPLFNKFRAPETWMVLTTFCFSAASLYGLDWCLDELKEKTTLFKSKLLMPLGAVAIVAFAFIFITQNSLSYIGEGELASIEQQIANQNNVPVNNPQVAQSARRYVNANLVPARSEAANRDSIRLLIFSVLIIGLIYAYSSQRINTSLFSIGVILLIGIDMIPVDKRYVPESRLEERKESREVFITEQSKAVDLFLRDEVQHPDEPYKYRVLPLLDNPFNNNIPSYYYPSIGGYSAAKLSIYFDLYDTGGPLLANGQLNLGILNMLNTKYIKYSPNFGGPNFEMVYNANDGAVFENKAVLPKAFFTDSVITASTPKEAFDFLFNDLEADKASIVETDEVITVIPDTSGKAKASVLEYGPREITLSSSNPNDGFLVISEIYYPKGWKAFIDDEEVPIYKTNYVLRGLEVPAGEHVIKMTYNPASYIWGGRIAWISNILILLIGVAAFFDNGKNDPAEK